MLLELSKSYTHSCNASSQSSYSDQELKEAVVNLMQRNGMDASKISQSPDGVLKLDELSNMKLHTLMLQAEELGLEMKYTKKTLIEIC